MLLEVSTLSIRTESVSSARVAVFPKPLLILMVEVRVLPKILVFPTVWALVLYKVSPGELGAGVLLKAAADNPEVSPVNVIPPFAAVG